MINRYRQNAQKCTLSVEHVEVGVGVGQISQPLLALGQSQVAHIFEPDDPLGQQQVWSLSSVRVSRPVLRKI